MNSPDPFNFFRESSRSRGSTLNLYQRGATGLIVIFGMLLLINSVFHKPSPPRNPAPRLQNTARFVSASGVDTTVRPDHFSSLPPAPVLGTLPSHPEHKLSPYFNRGASNPSVANPTILQEFHDLLGQFVQRQAEDDNFTVRVIDRRSSTLLELFELETLRRQYRRGESMSWSQIDRRRRTATRRLVDKYQRRGVPLEDITVRWGRANQIQESQVRNRPYRAYELQLARALDLSLLPTQIGTVETFNRNDLVSTSRARGRYQMLPWILRRSGVETYTLPTTSYATVRVEEAHHPLLTLEPAYLLLRGYINAVGHEIPGLSAYHTGPGNIYNLYQAYYTSSYYESSSTVADAYIWAVTEGFDQVTEETTFGTFSRGYVPSAYGALSAKDDAPVDLSDAVNAVRIQLKPSAEVSLKSLLTALDTSAYDLDWHPMANGRTIYERFKAFNPHFQLPSSPTGDVPAGGNVLLTSSRNGNSIQFFLPRNAPQAMRSVGLDVVNSDESLSFNDSTYRVPSQSQKTVWDHQYEALVDRIRHFGFSSANRDRLEVLYGVFEALAEARPTSYRQRQLAIIRTHRRIWQSEPWEDLSTLTTKITARTELPIESPVAVPSTSPTPDAWMGRATP